MHEDAPAEDIQNRLQQVEPKHQQREGDEGGQTPEPDTGVPASQARTVAPGSRPRKRCEPVTGGATPQLIEQLTQLSKSFQQ